MQTITIFDDIGAVIRAVEKLPFLVIMIGIFIAGILIREM